MRMDVCKLNVCESVGVLVLGICVAVGVSEQCV